MKAKAFDIKTSYFKKAGQHPDAVSIARSQPKWLPYVKAYLVLAPPWRLVNKKLYTYSEYYNAVLKNLDPKKVAGDLNGKILLCWEKDPTNCHRRYVAKWLEKALGIEIPEL